MHPNMPNMAKYAKYAYLVAPNMVKWGVPAKILQKLAFGLNKPILLFTFRVLNVRSGLVWSPILDFFLKRCFGSFLTSKKEEENES